MGHNQLYEAPSTTQVVGTCTGLNPNDVIIACQKMYRAARSFYVFR